MKATIIGENEDGIGVDVNDNNGVLHEISIEKGSWEVVYHDQDGYADETSERTHEQNEHVLQARRFAKFYVYRKRGYPTLGSLPWYPNPDQAVAVAAVIRLLSDDDFERYFGEYYRQMREYPDGSPPVEVPPEAENWPLYFQQEVYLGTSAEDLQEFIAAAGDTTETALADAVADLQSADPADIRDVVAGSLTDADHEDRQRLAETLIEAVSGVHVMWNTPDDDTQRVPTDQPDLDRGPDARLELAPYTPESLADFREDIRGHLWCQARDCYITMGIAPPEPLRIRGPGLYNRTTWYEHYDVYEPYHRTDVEITNWQEDATPDEFL